jgi:hypothetical protein
MTDGNVPANKPAPQPAKDAETEKAHDLIATGVAAVLVVNAATDPVNDETATGVAPSHPLQPASHHAPRRVRVVRSRRSRRSARLVSTAKTAIPAVTREQAPDTRSELRSWIKDNVSLLSNASLLISLAALAIGLLPGEGFLEPYIQALIVGAAVVLLAELHHQWPEDLQLHSFRNAVKSGNHSWRMTSFAFLMQLATVLFAAWATLNNPLILVPLTAIGIVLAFRRWYFRRYANSFFTRSFGIISLVAVLLISELMMLAIWATVADQEFTIELWPEERQMLDPGVGR